MIIDPNTRGRFLERNSKRAVPATVKYTLHTIVNGLFLPGEAPSDIRSGAGVRPPNQRHVAAACVPGPGAGAK